MQVLCSCVLPEQSRITFSCRGNSKPGSVGYAFDCALCSDRSPAMRLPRDELRRYIKETPFNRGEVLKLWTKFSYLDRDHSGYLALNVRWEGS